MNKLDKAYTDLLQDILDNGSTKGDRTGTGTLSVFGRQIRHNMKDGFPLLTTKKMPFKTIVTELLWFLRGDTNIKYLVDNNCHIWDGDAYKNYVDTVDKLWLKSDIGDLDDMLYDGLLLDDGNVIRLLTQEEFIKVVKVVDKFAERWGDLGPIYGNQWRSWEYHEGYGDMGHIDQITNLINDLKTNPDSRRLMVNAWNPADLQDMVLPPCHYGFQVYTRELSQRERCEIAQIDIDFSDRIKNYLDEQNISTRAISLMWNQRSVDTFLGLPFNIASYGLLLEIIAKAVNMVPDELIGNLGDVHLYSNHIEQAKEQIGRELSLEEKTDWLNKNYPLYGLGEWAVEKLSDKDYLKEVEVEYNIPTRTREPFPLPKLNINTEFWPTEGGECGEGPIDALAVFNGFFNDNFCKCLLEEDIQLSNYQSHPTIKAPLSN